MEKQIVLTEEEADDLVCFIRNHDGDEIPDGVWAVCMKMYEELYE